MRIKDKVCIITGAAMGIGRASALLFAREGGKVVLADINVQQGEDTANVVREAGGEAMFVKVDVAKASEVGKMVDVTVSRYGRLNVLFNNAGITDPFEDYLIEELKQETWDKILAINLKGTFLCCKYAIPEIIKSGGGSIINMASSTALIAAAERAAYSASKGGVLAFSRVVARQYAKQNIRCNTLCPHGIETHQQVQRREAMKIRQSIFPRALSLIDRDADPMEVAYMAIYLASDESSYVTGATFCIDGGVTSM